MAISKKNVSTADLKLIALEKSFHQSLALLTKHVIQQENRILKTLDTLKVKLKKAVTQQKAIKKPKKNMTPALEKQLLKAQIAVDSLELEIALATDNLNLMTTKADHLLELTDLCADNAPAPTIKAPAKKQVKAKTPVKVKAKAPVKAKAKAKTSEKPEVVAKTKAKAKPKTKTKSAPIVSEEEFNFSELFTPEMDLSFLAESEPQTNENTNNNS